MVLFFVGAVQPGILISQAPVYDAVIQGAEVRGNLATWLFATSAGAFPGDYEMLLSQLEDAAVAKGANAVMELSYSVISGNNGGFTFRATGVAVCDQRLANPFC